MSSFEFRYQAEVAALQFLAGGIVAKPSRQQVLEALREQGYGAYFIDEVEIKRAIDAWPKEPVWISIGEKRNASAQLLFSQDAMSATLELTAAQGGYGLSTDLVVATFKREGLVFGIDADAVNALIQKAQTLPGGHSASARVAFGQEPVPGEDSRFEPLVSTLSDRILAPREEQEGEFDFRDFGDMPSVAPGAAIMRRHPATEGVAGKNVFGVAIPATPGKEYAFTLEAGSALDADDPDLLRATRSGLPVLHARGMAVEDVYQLRDVDIASGHIRFDGNVDVQKDVAQSMEVSAGGVVHVGGFADSARMSSSGDMVIGKGVTGGLAGNLDELVSSATSGGNLFVQFAQFSKLTAAGHIVADKMLLHCRAVAGGSVRVGPESVGKGKIVGGEVCARHWIKSDFLGDEHQVHTVLKLNEDAVARKQAIQAMQQQIDEKLNQSRSLKAVMDKAQVRSDAAMLARVKSTHRESLQQMAELERQRKKLLDAWEAELRSSVVVVTKQLFPGVEITIADKTWKVNRVYGPGSVRYDGDKLGFFAGETKLPAFAV